MPYRINDRGSYILDWRCREIGRIRRATGVQNQRMLRKLRNMCDNLFENGRLDVLREIQAGRVRPLEVYEHWRTQNLRKVPSAASLKPISGIQVWVDTHEATEKTKRDYKNFVKRLTDVVGEDMVVASLPEALGKYRGHCRTKRINRAFNLTRSVVQAYLNATFGRHSEMWRAASNIKPLPVTPKRTKLVLSAVEVVGFSLRLEDNGHAEQAKMMRSMVMLGTNWKEYAGEWKVLEDRIEIKGTKRDSRVRVIPRFTDTYDRPTCSYRHFAKILYEESKPQNEEAGEARPHLTTQALRATFSHILEMAKIPRSRRLMYMGHSGGDVLGRHYEQHELDAYLMSDAETVRAYIQDAIDQNTADLNDRFARILEGKPPAEPKLIPNVWGIRK